VKPPLHRTQDARGIRSLRAVPDHPPPAPTADPRAFLRDAAARVLAAAVSEHSDTGSREDIERILEWLAGAAADAMAGTLPERGGPAANALGTHLLGQLRGEVVRAWAEAPPQAGEMLDLLEAMEHVRLATVPDWSNEFNAWLSGQDGLNLLVGVAHDLRSPLTSVLFLAETLGRGRSGEVNDQQRRQLRLIYSAALALESLASDVIELARGGERLTEKDPEPFSVAELFDSIHDMVLPIAEEKGVELRYVLPPNDRRIGRPLALSRVLLNLTTNALKFTDAGFVELTGVARGFHHVEFSVRDTGHGITPEGIANLFRPFRRTQARGRRGGYHFSGTGLGLAMCRKLLEAMGAELKYETRPDWGTRFYFKVELPIDRHI